MEHGATCALSLAGQGERQAKLLGDRAAGRVHVDQDDVAGTGRQPGGQQADYPAADHRGALTGLKARVPDGVERGLHLRGEGRAFGAHRIGHGDQHMGRRVEQALVRIQAERAAADEIGRTGLDSGDHRIAIFDRIRELALLQRAAHTLALAGRDKAVEHEALGAPADPADERARLNLPRRRRAGFGGSQFDLPGSDRPQSQRAQAAASRRWFSIALMPLRP